MVRIIFKILTYFFFILAVPFMALCFPFLALSEMCDEQTDKRDLKKEKPWKSDSPYLDPPQRNHHYGVDL